MLRVAGKCTWSASGSEYLGTVSYSRNGHRCLPWAKAFALLPGDLDPKMLPEASLEHASNFCRNLDGSSEGPWCITEMGVKEFCQFLCLW